MSPRFRYQLPGTLAAGLMLACVFATDAVAQRRTPVEKRGRYDAAGNAIWTPARTLRSRAGGYGVDVTDSFGNPRMVGLDRRITGPHANAARRRTLRSYQGATRRVDRRSGHLSFSLPSNARGRIGYGAFSYRDPLTGMTVSRGIDKAFQRYGGFGRRIGAKEPAAVSTMFARRYVLVEASAGQAPVRRALVQGDSMPRRPLPPIESQPGATATGRIVADDSVALSQRLTANLSGLADQSLANAWLAFGDRDYRGATALFQAFATLEPNSLEASIGVLLCDLARGALRTAAAQLGSLVRRFDDPFALSSTVSGRFADVTETRQVMLRARLIAEAPNASAPAKALYVLAAWYTGHEAEARIAARALAAEHPDSVYQNWPEKIGQTHGAAVADE